MNLMADNEERLAAPSSSFNHLPSSVDARSMDARSFDGSDSLDGGGSSEDLSGADRGVSSYSMNGVHATALGPNGRPLRTAGPVWGRVRVRHRRYSNSGVDDLMPMAATTPAPASSPFSPSALFAAAASSRSVKPPVVRRGSKPRTPPRSRSGSGQRVLPRVLDWSGRGSGTPTVALTSGAQSNARSPGGSVDGMKPGGVRLDDDDGDNDKNDCGGGGVGGACGSSSGGGRGSSEDKAWVAGRLRFDVHAGAGLGLSRDLRVVSIAPHGAASRHNEAAVAQAREAPPGPTAVAAAAAAADLGGGDNDGRGGGRARKELKLTSMVRLEPCLKGSRVTGLGGAPVASLEDFKRLLAARRSAHLSGSIEADPAAPSRAKGRAKAATGSKKSAATGKAVVKACSSAFCTLTFERPVGAEAASDAALDPSSMTAARRIGSPVSEAQRAVRTSGRSTESSAAQGATELVATAADLGHSGSLTCLRSWHSEMGHLRGGATQARPLSSPSSSASTASVVSLALLSPKAASLQRRSWHTELGTGKGFVRVSSDAPVAAGFDSDGGLDISGGGSSAFEGSFPSPLAAAASAATLGTLLDCAAFADVRARLGCVLVCRAELSRAQARATATARRLRRLQAANGAAAPPGGRRGGDGGDSGGGGGAQGIWSTRVRSRAPDGKRGGFSVGTLESVQVGAAAWARALQPLVGARGVADAYLGAGGEGTGCDGRVRRGSGGRGGGATTSGASGSVACLGGSPWPLPLTDHEVAQLIGECGVAGDNWWHVEGGGASNDQASGVAVGRWGAGTSEVGSSGSGAAAGATTVAAGPTMAGPRTAELFLTELRLLEWVLFVGGEHGIGVGGVGPRADTGAAARHARRSGSSSEHGIFGGASGGGASGDGASVGGASDGGASDGGASDGGAGSIRRRPLEQLVPDGASSGVLEPSAILELFAVPSGSENDDDEEDNGEGNDWRSTRSAMEASFAKR